MIKPNEILNQWRANKGKGYCTVPSASTGELIKAYLDTVLSVEIASNITQNRKVLIVVNSIDLFKEIYNIEYAKRLVNGGFLKIYTDEWAKTTMLQGYDYCICIGYDVPRRPIYGMLTAKFVLVISENPSKDFEQYRLPKIEVKDYREDNIVIKMDIGYSKPSYNSICKTSTPVEERRHNLAMLSDDWEMYKQYKDYIDKSVAIFGEDMYSIIEAIRNGDSLRGISAEQVKLNLAYANGWRYDLDMTYNHNVEIDKIYSPQALEDRAHLVFDIVRKRDALLTDNKVKISKVVQIIKENFHDKILIICKRAEFALELTKTINDEFHNDIALGIHPKLEPMEVLNSKGQAKIIKVEAQITRNLELFHHGRYNVLVSNNAITKKLKGYVDRIIITSPLCDKLSEILYRLPDLKPREPIIVDRLYIMDTKEEKRIQSEIIPNHVKIVNICEESTDTDNIFENIIVE